MPADSNLALQASVTKTATFNGAAVDLKEGPAPHRTLWARVDYSAATNASGSNSVTFSIDHSENNSDWYAHSSGAADALALSTTAQAGTIYLPIATPKRYVRLTVTVAGAGSTPTVTYAGAIVPTMV